MARELNKEEHRIVSENCAAFAPSFAVFVATDWKELRELTVRALAYGIRHKVIDPDVRESFKRFHRDVCAAEKFAKALRDSKASCGCRECVSQRTDDVVTSMGGDT